MEDKKIIEKNAETISDTEHLLDDEVKSESDNDSSDNELENKNKSELLMDNFTLHFFTDFDLSDIETLKDGKQTNIYHQWPCLGSFVESRPELKKFHLTNIDSPSTNIDQLQLKPLLKENVYKSMMDLTENQQQKLTMFQLELLSLITSYKNIFYSDRTFENANEIRLAYSLHALNHVLKTRTKIVSHNSKINQQGKNIDKEYRDQGLTRPKVLIILPFRDSAFQTVKCMVNLLFCDAKDSNKKIHLMNYKRFQKEFGPNDADSTISSRRPDDYKQLFANNIDDSFRIGLSLTKKSLKLFTDFYSSDIIIASPLGLRLIIGAPGEPDRDYDFLSSIEVVIMDQVDVFLMQNWEHVLNIMSHLHLKPKESHDVDFSRIKLWVLELWSKYYYQLLMFSSCSSSMINGFFNKYSTNFAGKLLFCNEIPRSKAAINQVYIQCPQIFYRFDCDSFVNSSTKRFEFFIEKILPKFRHDPLMVRTMIFVPSYFDFVRLRNYFRKEDISFTQICEYSKPGKVAKSRHIFFYGGRHFLLYTERYHFFNRVTIKGIRHLIFYEPPLYAKFYSEMINLMNRSNQGQKMLTDYSSMSVTVLYNKYDLHSILPLVGTSASKSLLADNTTETSHMFLTENVLGS